jgi:hypothetical protein
MLKKIISGGQPGVEIAALDAAVRLDLPHEGWCYKGRMSDDGVLNARYNVKDIDTPSYFDRLKRNIVDSEGTVVLSHGQLVVGTKAAKDLAEKYGKPFLNINLSKHPLNHAIALIRKWLAKHDIDTIYFTGTKTSGGYNPNVYDEVIQIIEGICGIEREQFLGFQEQDEDTSS